MDTTLSSKQKSLPVYKAAPILGIFREFKNDGLAFLEKTWQTLMLLLEHQIPVKVNTVVMDGKNTDDIVPMAMLTRDRDISVRFIEEMPFNGDASNQITHHWSHQRILQELQDHFPGIYRSDGPDPSIVPRGQADDDVRR